jgi:tripartite ATP-independent transporter DctP family solute receptor
MKRWWFAVFVSVVMTVTSGIAGLEPVEAQQQITIRLGNVEPIDNPIQVGLKKMSDLVAERTKSQVRIQIFPASQIGTQTEILEGMQIGSVDMYEGSVAMLGEFLADLQAFSSPFIWRNFDHMLKVVRGPIGQGMVERLVKAKGIRILDTGWLYGTRYLTTKNKAIMRPEDLKGVKIRVQPTEIYIDTIRAMGANPTPMDIKEVYLALQTGVIDGQENPAPTIETHKFNEVQKYIMLTGHILQSQAIAISEKLWQRLSPEFKKIISEAAVEAGDFQSDLTTKAEKISLGRLKDKGMTVVQPDVEAFRDATKDVHKKYAARWEPRLYERIQEVK